MEEDFDDFGDFASAFPTSSGVNDAKTTQATSSSAINQGNSADKVDFFASFPPPISSTSGDAAPLPNFTSFDAFSNHTAEGVVDGGEISDFGQFDVANMDLSELKIPSPTDPNVHVAGGVAFDIPPILDDDFSNPSSPTALPSQAPFQGDLVSADFTKVVANHEVKENHSDVHLSFPTSDSQWSSHQTQEERADTKDDGFGEFESSISLKTGLKTAAEPSNVEGGNLGLLTDNSALPVADSSSRDATNSGQFHSLGGDFKSSDDFGEFGDFTQSTGVDKTEPLAITNLGNSLDAVGFANFESTANAKSESKQPDTSTADDPVPPSSNGRLTGLNQFQSSEPTEMVNQDGSQQFGDFGAFSSSSATTVQEHGFGTFQTQSGSLPTTAAQDDSGQADEFGAFSTTNDAQKDGLASAAGGDAQFGDFGAFSSSSKTGANDDAEFGSFGGFQASAAVSTTTAKSDVQLGDFGAFSDSSTTHAKEDDFGNFGAFQTESSSSAVLSSTGSTQQGDDFGAFADSTGKDDDFGDFSTSDSGFGNFASSEPAPKPMTILKDIENVISNCFPGAGSSEEKQIPHTTTQLTSQLVSSRKSPESSENDPPIKVWTTLQKSIDFTVPLKKWDSSYMQDCYYVALKMDPKLVSKAGILPLFNSMGQFGAPLGGVTALDLLESFGFEGGLEAVTQEPSSPTSEFPFRSGSPGPALLDLSLPTSPRSPTNKNASFTLDADLLGLDLNPQSQGKPLTSIQELVLNEHLVVNRSTWMDSELLELGGSGAGGSHVGAGGDGANSAAGPGGGADAPSQQQPSSQPSTPRTGKKQNSIELQLLQLGLDASKTTTASASSHTELSLTARSTLGRLPDLSFMLEGDKIVRSTYQSGRSAS